MSDENNSSEPRQRQVRLHRELSKEEIKTFGPIAVDSIFSELNRGLNDIWADYITNKFYLDKVHKLVKEDQLPRVEILKLVRNPKPITQSKKTVFGIIDRIKKSRIGYNAFIDTVSQFEKFMSNLVFKVYMDHPGKLRGLAKDSDDETEGRSSKLLALILESDDRYEMINKLAEEKVRGIFYGNPLGLFVSDKARLEFGNYFKENHIYSLKIFKEATARRNIIIHNKARVDRKYVSEVSGTDLRLGQKVQIDEEYLRSCMLALKDIAAAAANQVSTSIYKVPLHGKAAKVGRAAARDARQA